jgi:hypothetical protein
MIKPSPETLESEKDSANSDHQSTLVAIGIGRHVRVGSLTDINIEWSMSAFLPTTDMP